jgi:hypothetical protein
MHTNQVGPPAAADGSGIGAAVHEPGAAAAHWTAAFKRVGVLEFSRDRCRGRLML